MYGIIFHWPTRNIGLLNPLLLFGTHLKDNNHYTPMKLLLTALCATFMVAPAFAQCCDKEKSDQKKVEKTSFAVKCGEGDCDKNKEKEEGTLLACKSCDEHKEKADKDKEEGTLLAGKDCGSGDCGKDKEEATLLV